MTTRWLGLIGSLGGQKPFKFTKSLIIINV